MEHEILSNYQVLWTKDGSPSLKTIECMHHQAGAYSETQYVYGQAIRKALSLNIETFSTLVVGLGLGYIELMVMGEYLKTSPQLPFRLVSFESDPQLKNAFINWLEYKLESSHPFYGVYECIGKFIDQDYDLPAIKQALLERLQSGHWLISDLLTQATIPQETFHIILYDAFSGKSTPELWTEEFLMMALKQLSAQPCVFSTYACTGVLKRALKASGYEVDVRDGFSGKKNSTMAVLTTAPMIL